MIFLEKGWTSFLWETSSGLLFKPGTSTSWSSQNYLWLLWPLPKTNMLILLNCLLGSALFYVVVQLFLRQIVWQKSLKKHLSTFFFFFFWEVPSYLVISFSCHFFEFCWNLTHWIPFVQRTESYVTESLKKKKMLRLMPIYCLFFRSENLLGSKTDSFIPEGGLSLLLIDLKKNCSWTFKRCPVMSNKCKIRFVVVKSIN